MSTQKDNPTQDQSIEIREIIAYELKEIIAYELKEGEDIDMLKTLYNKVLTGEAKTCQSRLPSDSEQIYLEYFLCPPGISEEKFKSLEIFRSSNHIVDKRVKDTHNYPENYPKLVTEKEKLSKNLCEKMNYFGCKAPTLINVYQGWESILEEPLDEVEYKAYKMSIGFYMPVGEYSNYISRYNLKKQEIEKYSNSIVGGLAQNMKASESKVFLNYDVGASIGQFLNLLDLTRILQVCKNPKEKYLAAKNPENKKIEVSATSASSQAGIAQPLGVELASASSQAGIAQPLGVELASASSQAGIAQPLGVELASAETPRQHPLSIAPVSLLEAVAREHKLPTESAENPIKRIIREKITELEQGQPKNYRRATEQDFGI